jgi:hypothetical protein
MKRLKEYFKILCLELFDQACCLSIFFCVCVCAFCVSVGGCKHSVLKIFKIFIFKLKVKFAFKSTYKSKNRADIVR